MDRSPSLRVFVRRAGASAALAAALLAAQAGVCVMAQEAAPEAVLGQPFATRHAAFEPVRFADVPGWDNDALHESANGMRESCDALRRKQGWSTVCAAFDRVDTGSDAALRAFFESNFHVYRMMSPARQPDGLITGYFEPLLEGRRSRDETFRFPVYGMPQDLLLLDAATRAGGARQWLRKQGQRLVPASPGSAGAREYTLALDDFSVGIRDKRMRVRIDGDRIKPYWSRQDIELRSLQAPVLAWVAAADRLYSMQIQGSGKIRVEDGTLIRVSYAEQNGHPFLPNITRGIDASTVLTAIKIRGLNVGGSAGGSRADPAVSAPVNDEVARLIALFQGNGKPGAASAARPPPNQGSAVRVKPKAISNSADVAALIAALKGGGTAAPRANPPSVASASAKPASARPTLPVSAIGAPALTNIPDPSYVFFRSSGDGPEGPIGALGVPLTAGRSLAVDPRSTPLGSPVFISTKEPAGSGPLRRLMFAQDTGGAIRGSVRGDLFWGFGDSAGRLALATNEVAQMWLLLPKSQVVSAAQNAGPTLRSLRNSAQLPDCVIDDPDLCVED
ncbi:MULTISPECIES: MltA domain-containing protein [unclassified Lysobacter]|uniref:MltA domain-containing protein n=2 Tax=Lysobacter TaxID=68 RepID=UPI0020357EB1|nr:MULTISPECIES: MltA domain-containing protein [unclassified Lysobacter]